MSKVWLVGAKWNSHIHWSDCGGGCRARVSMHVCLHALREVPVGRHAEHLLARREQDRDRPGGLDTKDGRAFREHGGEGPWRHGQIGAAHGRVMNATGERVMDNMDPMGWNSF